MAGSADRRRERRAMAGRLAFAALRVVALLALLPLGSTGFLAMPVSMTILAVWCGAVFLLPGGVDRLSAAAIALAGALAVYILFQSFVDTAFVRTVGIAGMAPASVPVTGVVTPSIAPGQSLSALSAIVMPFLVFAASLRVLNTDDAALRMLRFLAAAGSGVALFGIVQFALFPDTVLVFRKVYYRDSLTAVFVNRNSAATFIGCTLVILVGLTISTLEKRPLRTVLTMALKSRKTRRDWRLLLLMTSTAFTTVALFLTNSRAGTTSTVAALCCLVLSISIFGPKSRARSSAVRLRRTLLTLAVSAVAVLCVVVLLGGRTLRRIELRGTDDTRFCFLPDIWRMTRDAWPLGTGAGTFELAFAPYRNPDCGIVGAFDRAHNFFLEGAATLGIGFVVSALVVYGLLAWILLRGLVVRQRYAFIPATGLAVLVLLTLHDLLDFSLQIPGIAVWSAIVLAIACGTALRRGRWMSGSDRREPGRGGVIEPVTPQVHRAAGSRPYS